MTGDQKGDHLVNNILKSHLKKRMKEETFQLMDRLLTGLSKAVVVLKEVEKTGDGKRTKEMGLILVTNVYLIGIVD